MSDEKELLLQAWFQASNEAIYWNQMTNEKNTEITKQLLGIAALLIPLTGSIVITKVPLNGALKTLLIGSIIFFFVSIICGLIDFVSGANFFRKYTQYNASRAQIYHTMLMQNSTIEAAEDEIKRLDLPSERSENYSSLFQLISLGMGILLIIGVIITLLVIK